MDRPREPGSLHLFPVIGTIAPDFRALAQKTAGDPDTIQISLPKFRRHHPGTPRHPSLKNVNLPFSYPGPLCTSIATFRGRLPPGHARSLHNQKMVRPTSLLATAAVTPQAAPDQQPSRQRW